VAAVNRETSGAHGWERRLRNCDPVQLGDFFRRPWAVSK
jgi:hypothetical protein